MNSLAGSAVIAVFSALVQLWRGSTEVNVPATVALCLGLSFLGAEVGRQMQGRFLASKRLHVRGLEVLRLFIPLVGLAVLLRYALERFGSSPEVVEASIGFIRGLFLRGALTYTMRWTDPRDK